MKQEKTASLVYREKWQDPEFNKLFVGFKGFMATSEQECARRCGDLIAEHLPEQIHVVELGAGDGTVSLSFIEALSKTKRILSYTVTDFSYDLVKILRSREAEFKKYAQEVVIAQADGNTFVPTIGPHLIVAFSAWFGIQFPHLRRYLTHLEPGGVLALTLSTKESITVDLTIEFTESIRTSEDIINWLKAEKIGYKQYPIISQHLERSHFINGKLMPEAETFYRYLLRRPQGNINDIVPYLSQKPDLYFKTPKDLIILQKRLLDSTFNIS